MVGIVELVGKEQGLCKGARAGQPKRGSFSVQHRSARGRQIVEDISMLLLGGRANSHHRFHKLGTLRAIGPKPALAPEHTSEQRNRGNSGFGEVPEGS